MCIRDRLKTLEEPPSYVIFILATTEAHKIPITILSRCQRYDFKRISIDTISARLKDLMERENVDVEDKALRYIAKVADGSMRDALSPVSYTHLDVYKRQVYMTVYIKEEV